MPIRIFTETIGILLIPSFNIISFELTLHSFLGSAYVHVCDISQDCETKLKPWGILLIPYCTLAIYFHALCLRIVSKKRFNDTNIIDKGLLSLITCSAVIVDVDWSIGVRPGAVHTF